LVIVMSCCYFLLSCSLFLYTYPSRRSSDLLHLLIFGNQTVCKGWKKLHLLIFCNQTVCKGWKKRHLLIFGNQTVCKGWKKRHLRSEEHTSELQSRFELVCRLLLE